MAVEYFGVLTVVKPGTSQAQYLTLTRMFKLKPGAEPTRVGMYEYMRDQLPDDLKDGNTLFFSAEPNRVGAAR